MKLTLYTAIALAFTCSLAAAQPAEIRDFDWKLKRGDKLLTKQQLAELIVGKMTLVEYSGRTQGIMYYDNGTWEMFMNGNSVMNGRLPTYKLYDGGLVCYFRAAKFSNCMKFVVNRGKNIRITREPGLKDYIPHRMPVVMER